jgi:phospholipid/cholesterol/gamma-HCH transport system permease protein
VQSEPDQPSVEVERRPQDVVVRVVGRCDQRATEALLKQIVAARSGRTPVLLDLSRVESMDAAGAAVLQVAAERLSETGAEVRLLAADEGVRSLLRGVPAVSGASSRARPRMGALELLGSRVYDLLADTGELANLLKDVLLRGVVDPFRGRFPSPAQVAKESVRIGVDALPIVALIGLLLGLIMGFQAAHQLRQFGANIFVANLVGLGIVRELGPLMTAIVLAGRSGSSIAAELGTMVVREEVDALRTMGIDPVRYLVVPKVYAITVTGPALALFSMVVGILGGFFIAMTFLDLSATAYWAQTQQALDVGDLLHGLAKSLCFSWTVVLVSTFRGLTITGGAVGVGKATTSSVVASIFLIIVIDSIFTTASTVLSG